MSIILGLDNVAPAQQMAGQIQTRDALVHRGGAERRYGEPASGGNGDPITERVHQAQNVRHALTQQRAAQNQRSPGIVFLILMLSLVTRRARAELGREIAYAAHVRRADEDSTLGEPMIETAFLPAVIAAGGIQH